jgi:murein L,D-transpeptidase YcbB/YkuD
MHSYRLVRGVIVAFLGILVLPATTQAATVQELQAQITALQAQLQQLQSQLTQTQGTTATWCHDFNVNLKVGDSGAEVIALHAALSKEDSQTLVSTGDDNFSEITTSAVSSFQQKYKDEILTP